MEKIKLNIQLAIAVIVFLVGVGLVIAGFVLPPPGVIHDSVLIVFGEACTFSGSLIGIDYRYKFKAYVVDQRKPRHRKHTQHAANPEIIEDNIEEYEDY
jgi:hypothetical protein